MMTDYSLEMAARRIYDRKTKELFPEVLSSYYHGNYRSAVVGLWSVVVCDLLFKLDHLVATYSDPVARQILDEIEKYQRQNPTSPAWEAQILEKVKASTQLLDLADVTNLTHLRDHRHLCAHPVVTRLESLFTPSQDQVRAHLRNALDGVLTKPPLFTKHIFKTLLEDLEDKKNLLPDDGSLSRYLQSHFLEHTPPRVEDQLFRGLWKMVFRLTEENDPRSESNREINYRVLALLTRRRPREIRDLIQSERSYYSQISGELSCLVHLLDYLTQNPDLFEPLDDGAKAIIKNIAIKSLNDFTKARYLSATIADHIALVRQRIQKGEPMTSKGAFQGLFDAANETKDRQQVLEIGVVLFGSSKDSETADFTFNRFIGPYLASYHPPLLEKLLACIESNPETYCRERAQTDFASVDKIAEKVLVGGYNRQNYPHFAFALKENSSE